MRYAKYNYIASVVPMSILFTLIKNLTASEQPTAEH